MSISDIRMYEELLALLEQRFDEGEIDKQSYYELKKRYLQKLEEAKRLFEEEKDLANIHVSGFKTLTADGISIAGSTKISGGKILRDIRIAGSGKIENDIECLTLHSSGSIKIYGNLITHGDIKASGSFVCEGKVFAGGDINCSGTIKIEQSVVSKGKISLSGSIKVESSIESKSDIYISGGAQIEGNLQSNETIEIKGKTHIEGNIVGKNIIISSKATAFESLFFKRRERSKVEGHIVAKEEVDLQDVCVEGYVKGKIIKIGPNTKIEGRIYYANEIYINDSAKIETQPIKIEEKELF